MVSISNKETRDVKSLWPKNKFEECLKSLKYSYQLFDRTISIDDMFIAWFHSPSDLD